MNHTPGPWHIRHNRVTVAVLADNGDYVTENVRSHGNQEADARLIAAAPDLLEAAIAARGLIEAWMNGIFKRNGILWESEADRPPALQRLGAAIAKAEGQP